MKTIFKCFVLLLVIILCMTVWGCKKDPLEPYYWKSMPENTNPNLKYFGYYHFATSVKEVASHGNVNLGKADVDCEDEIKDLYDHGFYILIMIRHVFFDSDQPDGLKTDYENRWTDAKEIIERYLDKVIGFYVDEPIWTGKKQQAFHTACLTVREDYPKKRIMAMLSYNSVLNNSNTTELVTGLKNIDSKEYCKYCTDIGYDFYRSWDKDSVLADIALLKKNVITEGQDIWLSPKGFYVADPKKSINYFFENEDLPIGEDIKNWIKGAYEIAINDHAIVGFFTFVYGDDDTGEKYDMWLKRLFDEKDEYYNPEVKALYMQIGKAIIENV